MLAAPLKNQLRRSLAEAGYWAGRISPLTIGWLRRNGVYAYWYRKEPNFGDLITPLLLRHYGHTPIYTRPTEARLSATGSVLEHLPPDFAGIILGSGFIRRESARRFPKASILALRGELSKQATGSGDDVACGDPGILACRLLPHRAPKRFRLGVVPHYVTKNSELILALRRHLGEEVALIDPQDRPLHVFSQIDQCEHILSSSLHGLIVADSLGVPNRWFTAERILGGRFKFDDYYSSIVANEEPMTLVGRETADELCQQTTLKPTAAIEACKDRLEGLWRSLAKCFNEAE